MLKSIVTFAIILCWMTTPAFCQTFESPVEYMNFFTERENNLSEKYMSYISELAHGNRARKMEKRRQEVITLVRQSLGEATKLKPYKGDATLRDAYKRYWDIMLKVFNEDYHKLVNMEEIADQSYDNMEAYMLAKEKANDVLSQAQDQIGPVYRMFAANNNVRLSDDGVESKLEKKLKKASEVYTYHQPIYLIFFKSYKQETYLLESYKKGDINGLEQNGQTLARFAEEGLSRLDTIQPFAGDNSMVTACRKMLQFHKAEGEKYTPKLSEYLLKSDEFQKIKKAFDAKPAAKRTQADVDQYNKAVNEVNKILETTNKDLTYLNTERGKVIDNWNNSRARFLDVHVPKK